MSRTSSPRHAWLAVHRSTVIGATIVLGTLILVNLPGYRDEFFGRDHGWPFSYLHRQEPDPPYREGVVVCRCYVVPDIWSMTTFVAEFRPFWLVANGVVVLILTGISAAAIEYCRRMSGTFSRFSLRTACIGVVVLSVFFAWLHYRVARWNHMRPAIEQLVRTGARIQYVCELPEWIRELIGDRFGRPFDTVWLVDFSYTDATDGDLGALKLLLTTRSLNLASTRITDAGLQVVADLTRLDWLSLENTNVTDSGLASLKDLRSLECLDLDQTQVKGPGLQHLSKMDRLWCVSLRDTPLNDEGLMHLVHLPKLSTVYNDRTRVTRTGAEQFRAQSRKHIFVDWRSSFEIEASLLQSTTGDALYPFR
jgi:hypothetical protein